MRYYYADPTNNPVGPYQLEDLHELHAEGVIRADTLVAEEGGASWFPYRSLVVPPPPAPAPAPAYAPPPPAGPEYAAAPAYPAAPVGQHGIPQSDVTTAVFLHLSSFLGWLTFGVGLVIPILLWALNKDRSWFIDRHGVAYLNKLISYLIYGVVCGVLTFVLIGWLLLIPLIIVEIVATILAALAANRGELYEYPLAIRFMK